jgi:TolB-like protein/Tfp pilus assembly protein PilF
MSFFEGLKRRNVIRVALLYVVASWLLLQIADVLFPNLGAPEWAFRLVFGLLLLFFVPTLIFAWIYEITPEGLRRTSEIDAGASIAPVTGHKTNVLIIVLLVLAIGGLLLDRLIPESSPPEHAAKPVAAGAASKPATGEAETESTAIVRTAAGKFLEHAQPSIAVLPFDTRSDDRQDEYFSAGIHDDLLTQLAKIDGLKVISRTSVMQYADSTKPMKQIAAELGVATVLEGGVQRSGSRIRVNAQLIEARTDNHLWAETYDEELSASNIFSIQSRLATSIAGALKAELAPGVQERIDSQPTESLEAWDLALRGRYLLDKEQNRPNLERAIELFERAIEKDPGYAQAWAGKSQAVNELVGWSYWSDDRLQEAWEAAERAIELDPVLAEGFFSRGDLLRLERRYTEGEAAFLKGLSLSPGSADGHSRYGDLLRDAGRLEESVRESRKAIELDPRMVRIRVSLLQNTFFSRDFKGVLDQADQILVLEPDTAEAWYWIGLASCWTDDRETAVEAFRKALELDPDTPYIRAGRVYPYVMFGDFDKARELLEGAEADGWPLPEIGLLYGWLGDLDAAFEYMYRALDERPSDLHYLATDPSADPMRKDSRWPVLLKRLRAE